MSLQRVSIPEEAGVNSSAILDLLCDMEKAKASNHSFIIIKDDKIAVEKYNAPYSPNYAHSMFSVSKGFVGLAIGFLIDENKLTLDTPILDILTEFEKYKKDTRYERVTIRALLTMHSGKRCSFIRHMAKSDYAQFFMDAPFKKEVHFTYSNDDVFMLVKVINKLTGQTVTDYLYPRLFEPLGIEKPFWEKTYSGLEAGATGIYLKTFDLAKVCYCYLKGGVYEGKQVIPKFWAENAGKYYVSLPKIFDYNIGYGFYFWGDPYGGYRFDGMFGQIGMILPKYNATIIMTNCTNYTPEITQILFDYIPKLFEVGDGARADELKAEIEKSKVFDVPTAPRQKDSEQLINGKTLKVKKFGAFARGLGIYGHPQSMMPMSVKMAFPRISWKHFNDFKFEFLNNSLKLSWQEGDGVNTIECGMNGEWGKGNFTFGTFNFKTLAYAYWKDKNTLVLQVRPIETLGYKDLVFTFKNNKFTLQCESKPPFDEWALTHMGGVSNVPKWLSGFVDKLVAFALSKTHKPFYGKIVK